jgi:nucleoside-diphosphate-sugar epimerase
MNKIMVTGSAGQIGSELVPVLRKKYGVNNVVALAHETEPIDEVKQGPLVYLDARDKEELEKVIKQYDINIIYHLAGILSASGEKDPNSAWDVNMNSLKNVLDLAVKYKMKRVFWPSSIAAFGPTTPRVNTPQKTILEPTTMYGISKVAGEGMCNYYHVKYGLDVRSLRYPGLISYKVEPGGGTTDYAVGIFYGAIKENKYICFVNKDTVLPMMYMDDAIEGTIKLMEADKEKIKVRTSYNHTALSFSAKELAEEIKKHMPGFTCSYEPDSRQEIADSWPQSIDDSAAREDWGWKPKFLLDIMVEIMLEKLKEKLKGAKKS